MLDAVLTAFRPFLIVGALALLVFVGLRVLNAWASLSKDRGKL